MGTKMLVIFIETVLVMVTMNLVAFGHVGAVEFSNSSVSTTAMYVMGDSSVDCGDNTLLYPLFRHNLSLHPCNGSDTTLLPQLLAEKMGLPYTTPFYSQNGSIEVLLRGVNFGSALATIINPRRESHQSLHQQLRQSFETIQLLELLLGQESASHFIRSSLFYLSFGKDDYIKNFLDNPSGMKLEYNGQNFAQILVNQMTNAIRDLYDANVRRIVCTGVLPLGCAPRVLWQRYNLTIGDPNLGCDDEMNKLVLQYNTLLEEQIVDLNLELSDAQIVFCDVYRAVMQIITTPDVYGFKEVRNACCGLGTYGGKSGCLSLDMACNQVSSHVWWDLYNPTQAVNSLIADSAFFGQPMKDICRPLTVQKLASTSL